ncbi:hypothetical protein B0H13DRAFT_2363619 [Mycena leptocephala]|nr:hypothetical protein B0H13DRAFT_2363619 [Mycena leptocephala]
MTAGDLSFTLVQYCSTVWAPVITLALVANVLTGILLIRGYDKFSRNGDDPFPALGAVIDLWDSQRCLLLVVLVRFVAGRLPLLPTVLSVMELCFGGEFRQYMKDSTVLRRADFLVSADPLIWIPPSNEWGDTWRSLKSSLSSPSDRLQRTGPCCLVHRNGGYLASSAT